MLKRIDMMIFGTSLIGGDSVAGSESVIRAINPDNGEHLMPEYRGVDTKYVHQACELAWLAYNDFRETSLEERATLLETIAQEIESLGTVLVQRATSESGLPQARIQGE